jgi:hypothetical protein
VPCAVVGAACRSKDLFSDRRMSDSKPSNTGTDDN